MEWDGTVTGTGTGEEQDNTSKWELVDDGVGTRVAREVAAAMKRASRACCELWSNVGRGYWLLGFGRAPV